MSEETDSGSPPIDEPVGAAISPPVGGMHPIRMRSHPVQTWGPFVCGALGAGSWFGAVLGADVTKMGAYGLSSVLGWPYFLGLALATGAFAWELMAESPRRRVLMVLIVLEVVMLFGTASAVEPLARVSTAWYHAGFIQYIASHGQVLNGFDARFSWPGSFTLAAAVDAFTGHATAIPLLRWAPLFFELTYLAPLLVIARSSGVGARTGWLGTAVFYAGNWIEQDYFSPQALNMLFYLVVLATVLGLRSIVVERVTPAAGPSAGRMRIRLIQAWTSPARRWPSLGSPDVAWLPETFDQRCSPGWSTSARARHRVGVDLIVILLLAASTVSHQLTPFCLALGLAMCVVGRRSQGLELPAIAFALGVGWLSFGSTNFWRGHASLIFGGIGKLGSSLGQNVADRVVGSPSHHIIVDLRFGLGAAILLLAVCGIRRKAPDRALELLAFSPFLVVGVQSYGGEGLLRCLLFSLPFSSILAARTIHREALRISRWLAASADTRRWIATASVAMTLCVLCTWLTVVRGGNDAYESFTSEQRSAVEFIYAHARPGQSVAAPLAFSDEVLPWRDRDLGKLRYLDLTSARTPALDVAQLESLRSDWVIATSSEEWEGELVNSWPSGWQTELVAALESHDYHVARRWATAVVLRRDS